MAGGQRPAQDACGRRRPPQKIFSAFEEAERATDPATRDECLTFVVVGGGPTGVEISGQLAVLARQALKRDFRRIDPSQAQVILLDAGERVVPGFSEPTSARAAGGLSSIGVDVREGRMVTGIDERGVTVKHGDAGERIRARTVVWAAGVRTAGIAEVLARAAGASTDRGGRIKVNPDLSVPGHPDVSVIGDAASVAGEDGKPLPGFATTAIQQARHVATGIKRGQPGASQPFKYFDKGALAVVGRGRAVCEVRGRRLSGTDRLLDVPRRPSVLPGWGRRPAIDRVHDLDLGRLRGASEHGDRRRARSGRASRIRGQSPRASFGPYLSEVRELIQR